MRIGIAADHGGFTMKERLVVMLKGEGHEVTDFGALQLDPADDYPDFVIPWQGEWRREKWSGGSPSAAAGWERPLPQTRSAGCGPPWSTTTTPPTRVWKTTT